MMAMVSYTILENIMVVAMGGLWGCLILIEEKAIS